MEHRDSDGDLDAGPIAEYVASQGATFMHYYSLPADSVGEGRQVRFQFVPYGTETARIVGGSAKALAGKE